MIAECAPGKDRVAETGFVIDPSDYDERGNHKRFTAEWYAVECETAIAADTESVQMQLAKFLGSARHLAETGLRKECTMCWRSGAGKRLYAHVKLKLGREADHPPPYVKVCGIAVVDVDRGCWTSTAFLTELRTAAFDHGFGVVIDKVVNPGLRKQLHVCGFPEIVPGEVTLTCHGCWP